MQTVSRALLIGALTTGVATSAAALGFGRTATPTVLGQTLNFSVNLRHDTDEYVDAECASAEVTVGDRQLPKPLVRVAIEGDANAPERVLRVTTTVPIDEPVVSIALGVGCPPRLTRTFVAFVDPPFVQLAQQEGAPAPTATAVAPTDVSAAPVAVPQQATPPTTTAQRTTAKRSRSAAAPRRSTTRVATATAPRAVDATPTTAVRRPPATVTQTVRAPTPTATGPRLRLESVQRPTAADAAAEAEKAAAAAAAASAAIASAVAEATSQAAAKEAERVKALEDTLAKLRADTAATQEALAGMRLKLQQAEQRRSDSSLVYGLGGLSALLALSLGFALWNRSRERDSKWWAEQASARGEASAPAKPAAPAAPESRFDSGAGPVSERDPWSTRAPLPTMSPETRPAIAEPKREVSVEELIDLEQQAEFFTVLGQDEAAIDLLMNHLRSTGGISPLPYLKLLEIYRRRGEAEPYERLRERFNRRFNAYAPEWEADPSHGRSLDDYPEIMARLQALWPTPQQAMDLLESLLFRRDEGEMFDVPAYSEVLFLYSLARDRLERPDESVGVDLLLPLDEGQSSGPGWRAASPVAQPMVSTITMDAPPAPALRPATVDLDLSNRPSARHEERRGYEDGDFSFGTSWGDKNKPPRR